MVKLSPLLSLTPFLVQIVFADPYQDLCDKLTSLGLKKLSGYLAEVKKSEGPTAKHLITTLTNPDVGPLTLFAPIDVAWNTYKFDLKDPEKLASVLSYHLVHGHFPLGIDEGIHDPSFGAPPILPPPAGQVPPKQPLPPTAQPLPGSGAPKQPVVPPLPPTQQPNSNPLPPQGGQPWVPPNGPANGQPGDPAWNGNNQPNVPGNQPGFGGEWPQGGQQWPEGGGQGFPGANGGQPWQGGQPGFNGDPNFGGVFTSDQSQNPEQNQDQNQEQNQDQGNSDEQSQQPQQPPQAREEPAAPHTQTQLAIAGNPPIPYDTPNHVIVGRTTLFNPRFVMLEGMDRSQVLAWSNVTGSDGKYRMLHQETDCPVLKMTVWKHIVINVVPEVLHIPGSLPQLLGRHEFNTFKAMLKETTIPGKPFNMLDALDASNGWGTHGFTMFVVPDEMAMQAKHIIPTIAPHDPHAMATIMQNHVINGTTIYSPTLCSVEYPFFAIASSGGPLTFFSNGTGQYVSINHNNGGPMHTARILSTELVTHNGVVHVIDQFLLSPIRDDLAAAHAYEQSSIIANQQFFPEKGPVGIPTSQPPMQPPGIVVNNAARSKLDNLFEFGGFDLTRMVVAFSVLMGIWFSTAPI